MALVAERACRACGRVKGERHLATTRRPSMEQIEEWMSDGGCEATDGCWVEADGTCEHGHQSWMLKLGLV